MFKTFKNKLLFTYLIFSCIIGIIAIFGYYFFKKNEKVAEVTELVHTVLLNTERAIRYGHTFLEYETRNNEFYLNGTAEYFELHQSTLHIVFSEIEELKADGSENTANLLEELMAVEEAFIHYQSVFNEIAEKIKEKGYMNYGLEGKMRVYAHQLERMEQVDKALLLTLRRYEKDYLLRNDTASIELFNQAATKLRKDVSTKANKSAIKNTDSYINAFKQIVLLEEQIGTRTGTGLSEQLRTAVIDIEEKAKILTDKANRNRRANAEKIQVTFSRVVFLAIVLSLILSYTIANDITKPITEISRMIDIIIARKFDNNTPLIKPKSKDEIGSLITNLNMMVEKMRSNIEQINQKSQELAIQNDELKAVNKKLSESEASLKEINTIKNKFFSIISHDLRGPFNTLRGFLGILSTHAEGFTPKEIADLTKEMNVAVNNVYTLTNNLLQWSLSQTNGINVIETEVWVRKLVHQTVQVLGKTAKDKQITLDNRVSENLKIWTDNNILDFVIRNLVANAIKFTHENGLVIIDAEQHKTEVTIKVIDNGVGIAKEKIDKLFNIGERTTTKGTNNESGTGLGLILCKEFLQKCRGKLTVESEIGKGTTFKIHLPLR